MKKKVLSLCLALGLCLGLAVPALAVEPGWNLEAENDAPVLSAAIFQTRKWIVEEEKNEWGGFLSVSYTELGDVTGVTYKDIICPEEGTTLTLTAKNGYQVWLVALSDPDGDGIYVERLSKIIKFTDDGKCVAEALPDTVEGPIKRYDIGSASFFGLSVDGRVEGLPEGYNPYIDLELDYKQWLETQISVDTLLDFFGPNTLVTLKYYDLEQEASFGWNILLPGGELPDVVEVPDESTSTPPETGEASADSDLVIEDGVLTKYTGNGGDVTIPNGVTGIRGPVFSYCPSLTSLTIPDSVTFVGAAVFEYCPNLTDVYYGGTEEQWESVSIDPYGNYYLKNATIHYNSVASEPTLPETGEAKENVQTVKIDGKDVSFAMYSPDNGGTNYVRLVDLAVALRGTAGQFNVGYDEALDRVNLTAGEAYEGPAAVAPFHSEMEYTALTTPTYVDGVAKELEAIRFEYQNGGYTYYKLRDLGEALGFNVGWDNDNQRIYIETDKPYDPNN